MSCTMRIGCFCKDRNTAECELSAWDNASLALYEHVQKTGQHSRKLKRMGHGMVFSTFWRGEVIPFLPVACGGGLLFGQSRPSSPDRPCQVHPSAGIRPSSPPLSGCFQTLVCCALVFEANEIKSINWDSMAFLRGWLFIASFQLAMMARLLSILHTQVMLVPSAWAQSFHWSLCIVDGHQCT